MDSKQRNQPHRDGGRQGGVGEPRAQAGGTRFTLVFGAVVALTVLAMLMTVALAIYGDGSEEVRAAADTCSTTYKLGFGAIVGLIGAKSL